MYCRRIEDLTGGGCVGSQTGSITTGQRTVHRNSFSDCVEIIALLTKANNLNSHSLGRNLVIRDHRGPLPGLWF